MGPAGTSGWLLAVDFGTSNTAAAHADEATGAITALPLTYNSNLMPSAVFVTSPDRIEVGDVAVNRAASNPGGFVGAPKRHLTLGYSTFRVGQWDIPADIVVAAVLRAVLTRGQEHHAGRPPSGLVLTHPEGWSPQQIRVLTDAAGRIGYPPHLVRTVSEPRAAAQHYARNHAVDPNGRIAVFDFGGGTLDIAVLTATTDGDFRVTAARGDNALGGRNFDAAIRRWIEAQLAARDPDLLQLLDAENAALVDRRNLEESIRRTKELLSETPSAVLDVHSGDRHERLSLTRSEFEGLIARDVTRAVDLTRGTLSLAGVSDAAGLQAIYLTGGSSRIPLVHRELQSLGAVATLDDPKTVVAQGAVATAMRMNPAPPAPPPDYRRPPPPNYPPSGPVPIPPPARPAAAGPGRGRVIVYAVAALAVIGAAVGLGIGLGSHPTPTPVAVSTSTTTPAPDTTRYRLTAPDTVAGDFQKDKTNPSNTTTITPNAKDQAEYSPTGVQLTGALTATYHEGAATDDNTNATGRPLVLFGLWGQIADPERAVDGAPSTVMKDMLGNNELSPIGTLVPENPSNLNGNVVLRCQFIQGHVNSTNTNAQVPLCVWADHSTMGVVTVINPDLSLDDAATLTARVRDESLEPTS